MEKLDDMLGVGTVELSDVLRFTAAALAAMECDDREAEETIDEFCAALGPLAKRLRARMRAGEFDDDGTEPDTE